MAVFSGTIKNPVIVPTNTTTTPFSGAVVTDPIPSTENITVQLTPYYYGQSLGTLSDPMGGGSFDPATNTFTEAAFATGTPTSATQILNRLIYTPPSLSNGNATTVNATISVGDGITNSVDPNVIQIDTTSPPLIADTVANEPVASGSTIRPFGAVQIRDYNLGYSATDTATITLTDGGVATDADGLLTGIGLSKTGVGTYALGLTGYYNIASELQQLIFTPALVPAGQTRTTAFELNVADPAAGLSTDDKTTSVLVIGPPGPGPTPPVPPLITGTSGDQTVAPGNAIKPFNGVSVTDPNASPSDSAVIAVLGGGTLSGNGITPTGGGNYSIAASSPAGLTAILNAASFTPPPLNGQGSNTSFIALEVTDAGQTAIDTKTAIQQVPPPPASSVFTVTNQTTGLQFDTSGDPYPGPIPGIVRELIDITPDNLNIVANTPNVFIHSGSGDDAINVSKANGNNILDGSSGSNFLTGGTGNDTFFLDTRDATTETFSTVVNFHSGDNATVFGVNASDFTLTELDNQGAPNAKGLDFSFTAAGKPSANLVLAGFSTADIASKRLIIGSGTNPAQNGLPPSDYFNIEVK